MELDLSKRINTKSNLLSREKFMFMFSVGDFSKLYQPKTGLAAASIEHLALSHVEIPALEMETVCCSITS